MLTLGLEGTAHTVSASVLDEKKIYSLESRTFKPEHGGLNPREAAEFHFLNITDVITKAIDDSGFKSGDLELVGFSKGPGLPPSLKITAVAARSLALKLGIPIVGVNHPLGHIEIGRRETGAKDPVMLYVSGGNTQIISHRNRKYRVLGVTLDIGIGNMLDKIARDMGYPFPGGPEIEKLAGNGNKLLKLPYSVYGMDCAFSGIYTAGKRLIGKNRKEDVAFSIQEYSFSMLVETLERAIFTSGKEEILLAGGVARNNRLREMIQTMSTEANVRVFETPDRYCMDNGAMIGQAAILTYREFGGQEIEDTAINQLYRIDEVEAPWVDESETTYENRGAESDMEFGTFHQWKTIRKIRKRKGYRLEELDRNIRNTRMRNELILLGKMHSAGINVPVVFSMDGKISMLELEYIHGKRLSDFEDMEEKTLTDLARSVTELHSAGIIHGDLTLNNILESGGKLYIIDPSMGKLSTVINDRTGDIRLLKESINARFGEEAYKKFEDLFLKMSKANMETVGELGKMESRRRYA